jgi:transcriptional regulator with XRE-family HTH domain
LVPMMSSSNRNDRPITADIGWRVSRLRLRRGMSQNEIAQRTGKHTSFISRVERPDARRGVPKRETIEAILHALEASPEERAAVFQVEPPPPSSEEIEREVAAVKAQYDNSDLLISLLDARWFLWYRSPRFRAVLGLTAEEYERSNGEHALLQIIDPSSPMYSRYPDSERLRAFSLRAAAFQLRFAEHQFDSWYLELEQRITRFPKIEPIWHSLPVTPAFVDAQDVPMQHPNGTRLNFRIQLRQMYDAPRYTLLEVGPDDELTAAAIDRLARLERGGGAR